MIKTFAISTLGCKVNLYESEAYVEQLISKGYQKVDFKEFADIYIINTCTVTNSASSKSRQRIVQAKSRNENAFICVVGCYAQISAKLLKEKYDVDLLIGSSQKHELVKLIEETWGNSVLNLVSDNRDIEFEYLPVQTFSAQKRVFMKIQDGCNQFCSYCIIPYARGNERSIDLDTAVHQARSFVSNGHKEIVLSGIHTGRYLDFKGRNLTDLLRALILIDGLERIRISSIEVTEITEELLELVASSKKIANHFHIPLQSGSNTVLKRMNREYDFTQFYRMIEKIRVKIPEVSITSDVIVGFPSETDIEHTETIKSIIECNFTFLHVFPYSMRKGTLAEGMPRQVNSLTKKSRAEEILKLSNKLKVNFMSRLMGKTLTVLVEKRQDNFLVGHCEEYIEVYFMGDEEDINQFVELEIVEISNGKCYGNKKKR